MQGIPWWDEPETIGGSVARYSDPVCRLCRREGMKLFLFTLLNVSGAILGSSSSNLYRTDCLKRHPFPTDFGTSGDAASGPCGVFQGHHQSCSGGSNAPWGMKMQAGSA